MSIDPDQVGAVIPTRGNVDPSPYLAALFDGGGICALNVWNNASRADLSVYGRYAAIEEVDRPVILTQDDDVILPPETIQALLDNYEPGVLTANMPQRFRRDWYTDHCLVGFGAIFDRDLPAKAFARLGFDGRVSPFIEGDWHNYQFKQNGTRITIASAAAVRRTCDVVFTALTPRKLIDAPVKILDYAYGDDRMYKQPGHSMEREWMLNLCLKVKAAA